MTPRGSLWMHAMGGYTDKPIQSLMSILLIRVVTDLAVHPDCGGSVEDGMVGKERKGYDMQCACIPVTLEHQLTLMFMCEV